MNFKTLFYLLICILIASCGVKGPPVPPANTGIPSLIERYIPTPTPIPSEDNSRT